jgi:hypothetical protein
MKKHFLKITLTVMTVLVLVLSLSVSAFAAGNGNGNGNGNSGQVQVLPLTDEEISWLTFMREEEKLARDVYLELFDIWDLPIFSNIATSEQRHTDSVEKLLDKYAIDDPVVDEDIRGGFTDPDLDTMYSELLAKGSISLVDALEVGVMIEETDIADIEEALLATDDAHQDIERVYTNLLEGSYNHLAAFNSQLD